MCGSGGKGSREIEIDGGSGSELPVKEPGDGDDGWTQRQYLFTIFVLAISHDFSEYYRPFQNSFF